jgi:DNA-binding GntR family transcriptional regulator
MTALPKEVARPEGGLRQVVQALRRRIIAGEIPPGGALTEIPLAAQLGTSRATLREALAMLEERGLVERRHNVGAIVRRAGLDELRQLLELREVLEGMAAGAAAGNAEPDSWEPLVQLFAGPTEALVEAGDAAGFLAHHERLRGRILEQARNPALAATLAPLYDRTAIVMRRLVLVTDRSRVALAEHRAVLAALRAGDAAGAEAAKRAQLRSARQALERFGLFLL